ncbi:MAG: hypothetical protein QNK89_08855 [Lacinutrix sp.]|uniref:hypothetical protein n=1 Tax=Lacinutrix sp. TaxID=1937692 RepID=UPI00309B2DBC
MKLKRRPFIIIQIICAIGWLVFLVIEKLNYFEGYPTTQSELFSDLRAVFVVVSFIATLVNYKTKEDDKT